MGSLPTMASTRTSGTPGPPAGPSDSPPPPPPPAPPAVAHGEQRRHLPVTHPAEQRAVTRHGHALGDDPVAGDRHRRTWPDLLALPVARAPRPQREMLGRVL